MNNPQFKVNTDGTVTILLQFQPILILCFNNPFISLYHKEQCTNIIKQSSLPSSTKHIYVNGIATMIVNVIDDDSIIDSTYQQMVMVVDQVKQALSNSIEWADFMATEELEEQEEIERRQREVKLNEKFN